MAGEKAKTYQHADLRNALLKAALTLLRDGGQDAVTPRACAKIVGCAPSAVFRHFADRRALATGLATEGYRLLGARMDRATAAAPDSGRMRAIGEAYLDFALTDAHLFRLMFQGDLIGLDNPDLRAVSEPLLARTADATGADGDAQSDLAILAWAVVHGLARLAIDSQLARQVPADPDARRLALLRIMGRTAPLFQDQPASSV
ncbi:MAG: TetR-like C-terminal domain-containing protein [Pseudomonadota bacterium]